MVALLICMCSTAASQVPGVGTGVEEAIVSLLCIVVLCGLSDALCAYAYRISDFRGLSHGTRGGHTCYPTAGYFALMFALSQCRHLPLNVFGFGMGTVGSRRVMS